jgi:hypothetical protein
LVYYTYSTVADVGIICNTGEAKAVKAGQDGGTIPPFPYSSQVNIAVEEDI